MDFSIVEGIKGKDDGRHFRTARSHSFKLNGKKFVIPKGFITDFASVPRILWNIFPPIGRYWRAALRHDYLCEIKYDRKKADDAFLIWMKEDRVPWLRRTAMWLGVRGYAILTGKK